MEHFGKEKSPYHGVVLSSIFLVIIPLFLFWLFRTLMLKYQNYPVDFTTISALTLGFGVGFIFQFSCVIAGLMKGTFQAVLKRAINFFDNISISPKLAFKCYLADLKEYGVVFWIYFILIGSTLATTVLSALYLFENFNSYFM